MKIKKSIISSFMFIFIINAIFTSQVFAKSEIPDDIVSIEVSGGEYKKVNQKTKSLLDPTTPRKIIKARKKTGSKGIYSVDSTKEHLLLVSEDQFQPVGEVNLNLGSSSAISTLNNLSVGKELKDELIAYAIYAKKNGLTNANVSIYSPEFLTSSNDGISTLGSSSTSFYYQGKGGFTYKQESIFYTHWYTKTDTKYMDSNEELMAFAKKNISYAADTGIGLIPFYGQAYSLIKHFASLIYSAPIEHFEGSKLETDIEETSRETRFCYIRQNVGGGMEDYLRARSCFTNVVWHEELTIQGEGKEEKDVKEEYYEGEYFNNLDTKAYEYRLKDYSYDERLQSMTHSETGTTFLLAP